MTHEPECDDYQNDNVDGLCICNRLRDAYLRGREDAAKAVMRLIINSPTGDASLTDTMAAARGGEQEQLDHYADCDSSLGCTCGTRIIDNPQQEQE